MYIHICRYVPPSHHPKPPRFGGGPASGAHHATPEVKEEVWMQGRTHPGGPPAEFVGTTEN